MNDDARPFALMLGLAGGGTIAYWAINHMFVQGLTADERKNIAGFGLATAVLLVAGELGFADWLSVEGVGAKIDNLFQAGAP